MENLKLKLVPQTSEALTKKIEHPRQFIACKWETVEIKRKTTGKERR